MTPLVWVVRFLGVSGVSMLLGQSQLGDGGSHAGTGFPHWSGTSRNVSMQTAQLRSPLTSETVNNKRWRRSFRLIPNDNSYSILTIKFEGWNYNYFNGKKTRRLKIWSFECRILGLFILDTILCYNTYHNLFLL